MRCTRGAPVRNEITLFYCRRGQAMKTLSLTTVRIGGRGSSLACEMAIDLKYGRFGMRSHMAYILYNFIGQFRAV